MFRCAWLTRKRNIVSVVASNFLKFVLEKALNCIKFFWRSLHNKGIMHSINKSMPDMIFFFYVFLQTFGIYHQMHEVGRIIFFVKFDKLMSCIQSLRFWLNFQSFPVPCALTKARHLSAHITRIDSSWTLIKEISSIS